MAAVLLALFSAAAYGLSDFLGGLLSRMGSAWPVAVAGQLSAAFCTSLVAGFVPGHPTASNFAWAALAGAGNGMGSLFLYRGLANGRMGVVAPVSAVGAALVPVVAGLAAGEQLTWIVFLGVFAALPGIWLVSTVPASSRPSPAASAPQAPGGRFPLPAGLGYGAAAGLGFGILFVALGQIPRSAGLWPLAISQAISVPVLIAVALALGARWQPRDRASRLALLTGPLGTLATGAFLLATQHGYLSVAGMLASLYPAGTVLLATAILKERIHILQGIGLGLCAVAVACVAVG
jgi:drug/metabolite transporter (DMT)-like permease